MTQPDNFGFGEEASLLKESARKFFADNFPRDRLHGMVATDPNPERMSDCRWDQSLWQQMVDLGWTVLAVPESAGGLGMPLVAVAGLVEELGRAAFPCPLLGTLNATYVLAACGAEGEAALAEIAAGLRRAWPSVTGRVPGLAASTDVVAADGKLNGTAWFVQDARKVDRLLVAAQSAAGLSLYWVAADATGVSICPDAIVDLTRDQAHIQFDNVEAQEVSAVAWRRWIRPCPRSGQCWRRISWARRSGSCRPRWNTFPPASSLSIHWAFSRR